MQTLVNRRSICEVAGETDEINGDGHEWKEMIYVKKEAHVQPKSEQKAGFTHSENEENVELIGWEEEETGIEGAAEAPYVSQSPEIGRHERNYFEGALEGS